MSLKLKDDLGKSYVVKDLDRFKQHLIDFHSRNGKGDNSLHEENGYWFTVTPEFYELVMRFDHK
jgi:hypothetical protein